MYKKFLIIASKLDKAGTNITTALSQFKKNPLLSSLNQDSKGFDFYLIDNDITQTKNLNPEKINQYDFIIFTSKHLSKQNTKTLSIHTPGNPTSNDSETPENELGKISKSSALFCKQMFEILIQNTKQHELNNYQVTMEATHHGPIIDKPCLFIEIGSTEIEHNDRRAAFVIAKTINDTIENFQENPYNEIAIGIGGPHYCPNFNKIQETSNVAIAHIIPQYAMPISTETILEAIKKTQEEVDFAVLDWKGLGTSEQRQIILDILDKNYIQYKKTSEIKK